MVKQSRDRFYAGRWLTACFVFLRAGDDQADALLHPNPAGVPGHPVGGEDDRLAGSSFLSHPHHPSAHVHDRQGVLRHGDEMRKCLSVSATFTTSGRCDVILIVMD